MNLGFHSKTWMRSNTEMITSIYQKVPKSPEKLVPVASEIPNLIKSNQKVLCPYSALEKNSRKNHEWPCFCFLNFWRQSESLFEKTLVFMEFLANTGFMKWEVTWDIKMHFNDNAGKTRLISIGISHTQVEKKRSGSY